MRHGLFLVIFLAQAAFATNFEVTSHRLPEARDHLHNPAWQRQLARDKAAWDKLRAERGIVRVEAHQTVELKWPLREAVTLSEASVTQLNFYLDHDDSGDVLDWNCGDRAYDGHNVWTLARRRIPGTGCAATTSGTFKAPVPNGQALEEWGTLTIRVKGCDSVEFTLETREGGKFSDAARLAGILGLDCSQVREFPLRIPRPL